MFTNTRMKILLIVPDGVAVRNYIYSDFVEELKKNNFDVVLYHQIPDKAVAEIKKVKGDSISQIIKIPNFKETAFARILRETSVYARLLYNKRKLKNKTIMLFWTKKQNSFKRFALTLTSEIVGFLASKNYALILRMEHLYDNNVLKNNSAKTIEQDIININPDFILNLHQRALISVPIINCAKKRGIPTGTVIFSWDNVPKARLISRYDNYFVWSDLMKNQMTLLYPEINPDTIEVVGTPQFEFYFKSEFIKEKADFFAEYQLDMSKKTVCFSANDVSSPYEPIYFEHLCEEILKIESQIRPQILFRKCPVDKSNRFDKVLEKYSYNVVSIDPDWQVENENEIAFVTIYPTYNDIQLLTNTVLHSDVVVNLGSTMAHDFAVYNKPCLYLNYDPVPNSAFKVDSIFQFEHFKSMENTDAVGWINNKSEFSEKIMQALNHPNQVGKDRLKWMNTIVQHPLNQNSEKLAKKVLQCISV